MAKTSNAKSATAAAGRRARKTRTASRKPVCLAPEPVSESKTLAGWRKPLVRAAAAARKHAVAPYSKFKVGAALLTPAGKILAGANVESASYGLTCCAERVALFHALTSGERDFVAVAIVARTPGGAMPCGACRQLLAEYAPKAVVWVADSASLGNIQEFSVKELLPAAFVLSDSD